MELNVDVTVARQSLGGIYNPGTEEKSTCHVIEEFVLPC